MTYSDYVLGRLQALAEREAVQFPPACLPPDCRQAGVLIPLWPAADGRVELALTRRSRSLPSHQGQVSLPGGRRQPEDSSLEVTALRETHEELDIPPEAITVMGRLDDVWSFRGYHIVPFVGWLARRPVLVPDPREVDAVIIADLQVLNQPGTACIHEPARIEGRRYTHAFKWEGGYVWGLTADILLELLLWINGEHSSRGALRLEMLQRRTSG